jgi:type I restriction enzyme M protein
LNSEKLGKTVTERKLVPIIQKTQSYLQPIFSADSDTLGDAYEYLIGQFAAGFWKKAGEFYNASTNFTILSRNATLDSQDPTIKEKYQTKVLDFACGSGTLKNVRTRMSNAGSIGVIHTRKKISLLTT